MNKYKWVFIEAMAKVRNIDISFYNCYKYNTIICEYRKEKEVEEEEEEDHRLISCLGTLY